jgi:hypothetical protein
LNSVSVRDFLPRLLPRAIAWAEAQSEEICSKGAPLDEQEIRLASAVGVARPSCVRVYEVSRLPVPDDRELRLAAFNLGLLGPTMIGVTYGYGIYLVSGYVTNRLVSHECRHVQQYEVAGSISSFLSLYLKQLLTFGSFDAPLEIDARSHEIDRA